MMRPAGTVICFLCKGHVPYTKDNMAKFERHMATDHSAYFGMDYLLAGCKMTDDERLAVTDVVREKEVDTRDARPRAEEEDDGTVTTLEEGQVPPVAVEEDPLSSQQPRVRVKEERVQIQRQFRCSHCPKSFSLSDSLDEHLRRKHPGRAKITPTVGMKKLKKGAIVKQGQMMIKRRSMSRPRPQPDIPEGEGFPCGECGRVYRTEAMQKFHYTDVHVQGHFPCKGGCGKIFTSKNKMSSHWSRHCNDKSRRSSL